MIGFLRRRAVGLVLTVWIVVTCAFAMMRIVPGGPFSEERKLPAAVLANVEARYHLDWPLWRQYLQYVGPLNLDEHGLFGDRERVFGGVLAGDLGPSFRYRDYTVNQILAESLPLSLALGSLALAWAVVLGGAIGVAAAACRGTKLDLALRLGAALGIALPNFVVAGLLVLVFALTLGWSPIAGSTSFAHFVLPSLALGAPVAAYVARLVRSGLVEALQADWVRTAVAKGLPYRTVVLRHGLRAGLLPTVSYLGPASAGVLTGSLVIERIFALPGAGSHFVASALSRDYTLALGVTIVYSVLIYSLNSLVDFVYTRLDPRIALEEL
ncbi:MAG: ABC transporter permease subunit [Planctomycetes bacterium]|nr:ABC transporter permease subunit [Planctomycetota bacterium]